MSDSNSRLVYSTETGRIDEPKSGPLYALKATVWCVFSVRPVDVKVRAFA